MQLIRHMHPSWKPCFRKEVRKPYFKKLQQQLASEMEDYQIYPEKKHIFRAFALTPPDFVKVVIIGQDPYHGAGQANGLAFSVNPGIAKPPSLRNIFKELYADTGAPEPDHGDLSSWAHQGVLLLNTGLTVRHGEPGSHKKIGWHEFTNTVISRVASMPGPRVFLLWGNHAQSKKALIQGNKNFILEAAHPSPFSFYRGFKGCRHFSRANAFLSNNGIAPIAWKIRSKNE